MGMVAGGAPGGSCFCLAPVLSRALCGAEYGLKLGSQLFIKHIVESGLAAKGSSLQEGDLILKVRGPKGSTALTKGLVSPGLGVLSLSSVSAGDKVRACFSWPAVTAPGLEAAPSGARILPQLFPRARSPGC